MENRRGASTDVVCSAMLAEIMERYIAALDEDLRTAGDTADISSLLKGIRDNISLIPYLIRRMHIRGPLLEDAVSAGYKALLQAVREWRPDYAAPGAAPARLSSFACNLIKHELCRLLDGGKLVAESPYVRRRRRLAETAERTLRERLGRSPSAAEVAAELRSAGVRMSESSVRRYLAVPVCAVVDISGLPEVVADTAAPDASAVMAEEQRNLRRSFRALDERSRRVLTCSLGLDGRSPRTLRAIAADLGCSAENVRKIRNRALALLKNMLTGAENGC